MMQINIQLFGGCGAGSGGGGTGGLDLNDIVSTTSLISERESKRDEVDQVLTVLRDVEREHGVVINDAVIAILKGKGSNVLGYYDDSQSLGMNAKLFDSAKMDKVYDANSVGNGYHPRRGNKSGIEAVVAHEMGHRLTDEAGIRSGKGKWQLDAMADQIVHEAAINLGHNRGIRLFRERISGYAKENNAECVAEAYADVYCNGSKARMESKEIVRLLKKYLR